MTLRSIMLVPTLVCLWVAGACGEVRFPGEAANQPSVVADSCSAWAVVVNAQTPLYWYGHQFGDTLNFTFDGRSLFINGTRVPPSTPPPQPARTHYPHWAVQQQADLAETFEEFADVYRRSPLVRSLTVGRDELVVDWVDDDPMGCITVLWRPCDRRVPLSFGEVLYEQVSAAARWLDRGYAVWSHGPKLVARKPNSKGELPGWVIEDLIQPVELPADEGQFQRGETAGRLSN